MEEKVTVEWEQSVEIDEIAAFMDQLPDRLYTRRELRSFVSGYFRDRDDWLPGTKISNYRVSGRSMSAILGVLEQRGVLSRNHTQDGLDCWTPKPR